MPTALLSSIQTGKTAPLGPAGVPSGFVKMLVEGPIRVEPLGLIGDEQADPRVHGGPEKAVYGYAAAHYPAWAADFPDRAHLFAPGGVGENLTISGLTEAEICVGDIHAIGTALLQVCQPRQPCFKFALRFGDDRLPHAMIRNGRAGWYYRVLRPGEMRQGDVISLLERPNPDFAFSRLVEIVYRRDSTPDERARLAEMPEVASQIRAYARRSLHLD